MFVLFNVCVLFSNLNRLWKATRPFDYENIDLEKEYSLED